MPGIFGLYRTERSVQAVMGKMIQQMCHGGTEHVDSFLNEKQNLCMGRVSLGVLNQIHQPVPECMANDCFLFFHGELYEKESSISDPEYILKLYIEKGNKCVEDLNGIFHFVIYDKRSDEIKLFTDKFGLQPIYFSNSTDSFVFAAEVKSILQDKYIERSPDYEAIADFFHCGHIIGSKTLLENIQLLDPGSILNYSLKEKKLTVQRYWELENVFVENGLSDSSISDEDVVGLLKKSIRARSNNRDLLGLSLSGGLDSRGILAGLEQDTRGLNTYTLGLSGCADQVLSAKMAKITGANHDFLEMNDVYLKNFEAMASTMIHLSDGMYHPHESTEMLALDYFKTNPFKILLRGHGGEIAKAAQAYPVMVNSNVKSISDFNEATDYIYNLTNLVLKDIQPENLFVNSFKVLMKESPRRSLGQSCGMIKKELSSPDLCIWYYINEVIRRQVVSSLDIFRSQIEIRMPYIDEAFITSLMKLPLKKRNDGEIHVKLIRKCMPELLKIPNSNTGAPLDAGPFRLLLTDKFNSLMKKLSVKGFRHYTEFQKWHRQGFKNHTERIIFSEQSRARQLYNMDYLKQIYTSHISGHKNYGHLLGTIVSLELWFRNFIDNKNS